MLKGMKLSAILMLTLIMIFTLCTNAFAARVGQQLPTKEAGWRRYDSGDAKVTKTNWQLVNASSYYQGTGCFTYTKNLPLTFKFVGDQLRLIGNLYYLLSENVTVKIDGVSYRYSQYSTQETWQVLVFEKTGLSYGLHEVEIINTTDDGKGINIDAIDINETGYLVNTNLNAPIGLTSLSGDSYVSINWQAVTQATSYSIKRALTPKGPYTTIASSVTGTTYTDINVTNGTTYYYVVTAVNASGESSPSNEGPATPQGPVVQPETGRAILTITLDTGLEKEYDLSMTEVNSFISWYEAKASGTGTASFAIDKHDNNKGPFKNRKDYVIFEKILTFQVNEYEVNE